MSANEELFTAAEAAGEVAVKVATIHQWVSRKYLSPVPGRKRGKAKLYRIGDVYTCEATRRHEHRRKDAR